LEFLFWIICQAAEIVALIYLSIGGIVSFRRIKCCLQNIIIKSDIWKKTFKDEGRLNNVLENTIIIIIKVQNLDMRCSIDYSRWLIEQTSK